MFESIGFSEMLLVAVIALIVFGPEKFPEYAKIFLRAMRDLQGYFKSVRDDLAKEVNPLKNELDKFSRQDPEKLLDALMKTGDKDQDKNPGPTTGANELVAGASDTPQSDADNNPYMADPGTPPVTAEAAKSAGSDAEPARTGDGEPHAENQDFNIKPPDRLD